MKKLYYTIKEVSELVDEEQHTLRYWEKEFGQLSPKKNTGGNRKYEEKDIEIVKQIKHLVRVERLSLKGVKEHLKTYPSNEDNKGSNLISVDGKQTQIPYVLKKGSKNNTEVNMNISKSELIDIYGILKDTLVHLRSGV